MSRPLSRLRRTVARARRAVRRLVRHVIHSFRASLRVRIMASALTIGVLAVAALGLYLSTSVRDGMVERRLSAIDSESSALTDEAERQFHSATVADEQQAQQLMSSVAERILQSASNVDAVFLVHPVGTQPQVSDVTIPEGMSGQQNELLSAELRRANADLNPPDDDETDEQVVQFAEIVDTLTDQSQPGVVVGSSLQVPRVGEYEIYYVYSLQQEQETLTFVHRVLGTGAAFVLLLIGLITAMVSRQTVAPVTRAATVAERLADGHLDERLPGVSGIDEMATLSRSFNAMADSLQQQIRDMEELSTSQRRFASDVSHELRTPLTTIRMAGDIIHAARDQLDPAASRSAELLYEQIDRFESLLADLLEISRFDAGAAVLDAERQDLGDVVDSVVQMAQPLADNKEVPLSVVRPDDAVADFDSRRIERIVRNLVVNAIEHAEGRPVEVTVGADDQAVAVVVRDYGVGMTTPEVEHVFDRFWRADPARTRTTGGTGLGLSISHEDARLHNGRLEVWGRPGRGASFRLTLPRRTGITLDTSPVPLVPDSHAPEVVTDQVPVAHPPTGPQPTTIPDLEVR